MAKLNPIERAVDLAIDMPHDASEDPNYYARQAGPFAMYTGGNEAARQKMQGELSPYIDQNITHGPNNPQGNVNEARQALFAMQANAPYGQNTVKGIGSTGLGTPGAQLVGNRAGALQLQGNTYAATPDADEDPNENIRIMAQHDPTGPTRTDELGPDPRHHPRFPTDERGGPYGSSGPAENASSTKTPMSTEDYILRGMQTNEAARNHGNETVQSIPAMRQYLDKVAPNRRTQEDVDSDEEEDSVTLPRK